MSAFRTVYHVTPLRNLTSIWRHGINPAFAQTRVKGSWFCSRERIEDAIQHVARRHCCPRDSHVVLLECRVAKKALTKKAPGIFVIFNPVDDRQIVCWGVLSLTERGKKT